MSIVHSRSLHSKSVVPEAEHVVYLSSTFRQLWNIVRMNVKNNRELYIYEAAAARAEFDVIYCEKDMRKSKEMLLQKEKALLGFPLPPIIFPTAPDGVDYERTLIHMDSCLDHWHPYEKAAYPEYFARREIRKQQYVELWEKMHGPPKPEDYGTH